MKKKKNLVYVRFPKTGLGNMLLVWARGVVFARLNDLRLVTSSWWGFRWGTLFRGEQRKRLYWRYFMESPVYMQITVRYHLKYRKLITEPQIEKTDKNLSGKNLYLFNTVMTDADLFGSIREYKAIIIEELYKSLHPSKKILLLKYEKPVIGIHIRRGDFNLGSMITPLNYFIKGINIIRQQVGQNWPVTVFTDAGKEEIAALLSLDSVNIADEKADILDILLLSKSKVLLLSAGSTFSYWAAFLSDAFVIRPMNDWLINIKTSSPDCTDYFEIKWQYDEGHSTALLKESISKWHLNVRL